MRAPSAPRPTSPSMICKQHVIAGPDEYGNQNARLRGKHIKNLVGTPDAKVSQSTRGVDQQLFVTGCSEARHQRANRSKQRLGTDHIISARWSDIDAFLTTTIIEGIFQFIPSCFACSIQSRHNASSSKRAVCIYGGSKGEGGAKSKP